MSVPRLVKDFWPAALIALAILVGLVLYPRWRSAVDTNRDARADPHHIAGNLYFVGTPDIATFLLVGSEGHVLIGGGSPRMAYKIIANIEQLGFEMQDIRILLASDPHSDEAGGLRDLQQASGAELWTSDANADVIARGGRNDPSIFFTPRKLFEWAGVGDFDYQAPRVDHRIKDGDTVRLGALAITAHMTPGHAPGCTTWTFTVRDQDRDLHVVDRCSLTIPYDLNRSNVDRDPRFQADFERSFQVLRSLPVDIWLTSHGVEYGRYRKYQASLGAQDPVAPFIDREGYFKSIDDAEQRVLALFTKDRSSLQPGSRIPVGPPATTPSRLVAIATTSPAPRTPASVLPPRRR